MNYSNPFQTISIPSHPVLCIIAPILLPIQHYSPGMKDKS